MPKLIHGQFELIPQTTIGQVDLIIADPPDNIGLKYDGFNDNVSLETYQENMRNWLSKMVSITDGPVFFTFNEKWIGLVERLIEELGIKLIQRLNWYYTFGQDQTRNKKYALCFRPIYWLNSPYCNPDKIKIPSARQSKYGDKRASKNGKMPPNVWEFSRICGTFKERRRHCPTQLPEMLVQRIVDGHLADGGRVLDPFLGSGTTGIVCNKSGVDWVGVELSGSCIEKTSEILGIKYE